VRMRRRKVDRQALVDDAAGGVAERQVGRVPGRQRASAHRVDQRPETAPRDADDADRAAAPRGGDRDGRCDVAIEHRCNRRTAPTDAYLPVTPSRLLMMYCCTIDSRLLVT